FVGSTFIFMIALASVALAQGNRQFTINDLLKVRRVGDPRISPDGQRVAFTIGDVNFDANRIVTHIYLMPLDGGAMKQVTSGDRSASSPRWSPDGKKLAYTTGSTIWAMDSVGDDKSPVSTCHTSAA